MWTIYKGLKWLDYINLSLNETELSIRKAKYDLSSDVNLTLHEQTHLFRHNLYDYSRTDFYLLTIFHIIASFNWLYLRVNLFKNFTLFRR